MQYFQRTGLYEKNTKILKNHLKYADESAILKKLWHDSDEA